MNENQNLFPATIRVIGFGEITEESISKVKSFGFDGLQAEMYSEAEPYSPSESDKIVILLSMLNSENVRNVAKTFNETDVLTIGVSDQHDDISTDYIYSYTVVDSREMAETVKMLVEPILTCGWISYDFHDMKCTFSGIKRFRLLSGIGKGENRMAEAMEKVLEQVEENQLTSAKRLCIFLYAQKNSSEPLRVEEINVISEFVQTLPKNIEVMWALYDDPTLAADEVRICLEVLGVRC